MNQKELALRTDFSEKHISKVISGKADITANFAMALETVFNIDSIFWINLQGHYDIEKAEIMSGDTVDDKEVSILKNLKDVNKYFIDCNMLEKTASNRDKVLQLRKILRDKNLSLIPRIPIVSSFRLAKDAKVDPYVLFSWIRICEIRALECEVDSHLCVDELQQRIPDIKKVMFSDAEHIESELRSILSDCGIRFCIVKHFPKAPVQGFIQLQDAGDLIMCLTIRRAYADIFWFTLFHEIGHIINGDIRKHFIDFISLDTQSERDADDYAKNTLLDSERYALFKENKPYTLHKIISFAEQESVKPYVVIGRLQKERALPYDRFTKEKPRYKWVEGN
jgi:HTH-type transcriptional regulator/antitoxin HigA